MYYTYMIRCEDGSIYTGMAKDIEKRMNEHFSQNEKCAKYTKRHKALFLESAWLSESRASASKLEYHIKKLSKQNKEYLIKEAKKENALFEEMSIQKECYKRLSKSKIKKINEEEKSQ